MLKRWAAVAPPLIALLLLGSHVPSPVSAPFASSTAPQHVPAVPSPAEATCVSPQTGRQSEQAERPPHALKMEQASLPSLPPTTLPLATTKGGPLPASDTLRSTTPLGTPLILSLPAQVNEIPVTRYTLIQGPSLSGVAKQSFAWIPRDTDPGIYNIHLQAHHPDAQPDTLVLRVDVES